MTDNIYLSDEEIELHEYEIKGNILIIDNVEYLIKSATNDGFNVIAK